jgi:peptidoglycan L-alanyl-D-glutamate endopeptidase CwlK
VAKYRADDITKLLPAFQERLQELLDVMVAAGYQPLLFDGFREPAEAAKNAAKGVGTKDSMHCLGIAADVIDAERGWKHPEFFERLGKEAERIGLTWGGRWARKDLCHVQAIPVSLQAKARRLKPAQLDDLVRQYLINGTGRG